VLGLLVQGLFFQTVLSDGSLAEQFLSRATWRGLMQLAGTPARPLPVESADTPPPEFAEVPYVVGLGLALFGCTLGLVAIGFRARLKRTAAPSLSDLFGLAASPWQATAWWCLWLPGAWELARLSAALFGLTTALAMLTNVALYVPLLAWGAWLARLWPLSPASECPDGTTDSRVPRAVWVAAALYLATFFALNVRLWQNLWIPHGDSAMYEEHLWNLLHGKGFRSYLDNGRLFLGEHVQVIHLLLAPAYVVWPHHLLLEFSQSAALAATAIPVYWIALRHTGDRSAATLFALAALAYPPLQFLDLAIDFKTFRPNAFEIPVLLFALDAYERGRVRTFVACVFLALLCQEDIAPVLAPLGLWIAFVAWSNRSSVTPGPGLRSERVWLWLGTALAVFATLYTVAVIKWVLPWFRGGADVHFATYFSDLGGSTGEIVTNLFAKPWLFFGKVLSPGAGLFAAALLLPLGGLSLLAPGRFLVALPLLLVLGLNQLSRSPVHHFHAPLVPVLLWSAAAGLGTVLQGRRSPGLFLWTFFARSARTPRSPEDISRRRIPPEAVRPTGKSLPTAKLEAKGPTCPESGVASPNEVGAPGNSVAEDVSPPPNVNPRDPSPHASNHPAFRRGKNTPQIQSRPSRTPTSEISPGAHPAPSARTPPDSPRSPARRAVYALCVSFGAMFFTGLSPGSLPFWDSGSRAYWRRLYGPSDRGAAAAKVVARIPLTARVASTDFIHPRFTHHARSYDYSDYRPVVLDDTDYIVIDTTHPYSTIRRFDEIKEFATRPDAWEPVDDTDQSVFLVLRRTR
jgi:uncharacterized membrane protein